MAVYNEILAGRFNRALQKITSIKGSPPVRTLGSEILPVFPLFWGVENRYLEGWDRFGAAINQPAGGAGTFSQVRLRNPVGSNVIAVFEKLTWCDLNAAVDQPTLNVAAQTADLATGIALTANRFDPRGRPQPTLIASRGTPVVGNPGTQWFGGVSAGSGIYDFVTYENQEVTLLPGDALSVGNNNPNNVINFNFWWRERFLEDSERF